MSLFGSSTQNHSVLIQSIYGYKILNYHTILKLFFSWDDIFHSSDKLLNHPAKNLSYIYNSIYIETNTRLIHNNFSNHHYRYNFKSTESKNCVTALDIYEGISRLHFPLYLKKNCFMQFRKMDNSTYRVFNRFNCQRARIFSISTLRKTSAK